MTSETCRNAAQRVTRDVEPSALKDLLEHPPRATVAFVDRDEADVLPVRARFRADTYRFGVLPEVATDLENREVVLVIDHGPYWFELRCISVRGLMVRDRAAAHPRLGLRRHPEGVTGAGAFRSRGPRFSPTLGQTKGGPAHVRVVPTTAEFLSRPPDLPLGASVNRRRIQARHHDR
jgi:hypothetical protein